MYEVEHENVGTEGAHHSELVGEAVGRKTARTVRQAVRDHPAKAAARAERRYVRATAEHRFQVELEKHPDLGKNALARFAQKQRQKRQYAKQAREAAKQGARAAEKTAVSAEKLAEKAAGFVKRHPGGVVITLACLRDLKKGQPGCWETHGAETLHFPADAGGGAAGPGVAGPAQPQKGGPGPGRAVGMAGKKRRRSVHLHVMVTPEEQQQIQERMAQVGILNMGAYMRKMALNGYVLQVDLSPVRELVSLQRRCANNLNQAAANGNGI